MDLMLCPNPLNHVQLTMEKGFRWCPTFSKLINLTLDCSFVNGNFYGLIVILQNTPNLRRLTLNVGQVCGLHHIMDYKSASHALHVTNQSL
jgi:hypothetical protein